MVRMSFLLEFLEFLRNAGNEVFTHTEKASRRVPALTTTLAQAFQFLFAKGFITTA